MKIKALLFATFTIITLVGCNDKEQITEQNVVTEQKTQVALPTFNLKTTTGTNITIVADNEKGWIFKGLEVKAILLDFFGTWCPPCKAEIPHLNNIRNKISDKFEVIGIDVGPRGGGTTSLDDLKAFVTQYEIKYPVTIGGDNSELFRGVMELNKNGSIPFMLLFDQKGHFVTHYIGMVPEEMLQGDIDRVLGK